MEIPDQDLRLLAELAKLGQAGLDPVLAHESALSLATKISGAEVVTQWFRIYPGGPDSVRVADFKAERITMSRVAGHPEVSRVDLARVFEKDPRFTVIVRIQTVAAIVPIFDWNVRILGFLVFSFARQDGVDYEADEPLLTLVAALLGRILVRLPDMSCWPKE